MLFHIKPRYNNQKAQIPEKHVAYGCTYYSNVFVADTEINIIYGRIH